MNQHFDFSFDSYDRLMGHFNSLGYSNAGYFDNPQPQRTILLRHDIDIDIFNCEHLSEFELEHGFSSTWFFQPNNDYYNPLSTQCLRILNNLSAHHTLGLHIDPVLFSDIEQLEVGVKQLYDFYSCYLDIKPVFSFHRPAKYLSNASAVQLEGFVNAYSSCFMDKMTYVSDSNRRKFFEQDRIWNALEEHRSIILLTHPLWWHEKSFSPDQLYDHLLTLTNKNICRHALAQNITMYGQLLENKQGVTE